MIPGRGRMIYHFNHCDMSEEKYIWPQYSDVYGIMRGMSPEEFERRCGGFYPQVATTERHSGRTTRRVDACLQVLFTDGEVAPRDHHYHSETTVGHQQLACRMKNIICRRLRNEHPHVEFEVLMVRGWPVIRLK